VVDAAVDEAVIMLVVEMGDHFPRFHPVDARIRMLLANNLKITRADPGTRGIRT